jgi:hypothetical protein
MTFLSDTFSQNDTVKSPKAFDSAEGILMVLDVFAVGKWRSQFEAVKQQKH